MHRFFVDQNAIKENLVEINNSSDYDHVARSLRLEPGAKIVVCDGAGRDYITRIIEFNQKEKVITGKIMKEQKNKGEPDLELTLAQALPKNRNMELVAEKCTEIGIKEVIPLETERTIVKLSSKKEVKRIKRWQRITEAAAKQSQRGIIPEVKKVHNIKKLDQLKNNYDLIIMLWTKAEKNTVRQVLNSINQNEIEKILIIIGPEGGFTRKEVDLIKADNDFCYTAGLGSRILRTETAGAVVSSIIMYVFEEFE